MYITKDSYFYRFIHNNFKKYFSLNVVLSIFLTNESNILQEKDE